MKTLHLTLKKKWYDMIESGEKSEEYREIKPYWTNRFYKIRGADKLGPHYICWFDRVVFKNGYSKTARSMEFECLEILVGPGKFEWGALRNESYFVIKLGNKLK